MKIQNIVAAALLLGAFTSDTARADACRITTIDAFAGVNAQGEPDALGLKARVDSYGGNGLLYTMGGRYLSNIEVDFYVLTGDGNGEYYLGSSTTDGSGTATLDLAQSITESGGFYTLEVSVEGAPIDYLLSESQYLQVVAKTAMRPDSCDDGVIHPDVFGSIYFRHPDDFSPILVSDFDDTLFDSADPLDVIRATMINHWLPLDNAVVAATRTFRESGGVFVGLTAQPHRLRPFTRSDLLWWGFDDTYILQTHNYDGAGYNATYLPRTLSYIANDEYADGGDDIGSNFQHCDYKVEKLELFTQRVLGGDWGNILGIIGDSEKSDGCAADELGLLWYALMEDGDSVSDDYGNDYAEFKSGWAEALPLLCIDAGLSCAP